MIRCLEDKTLFLLSEGEAGEEQRSHLQSCQACTERYHEIERDLRLITQTLAPETTAASSRCVQSTDRFQIFAHRRRSSLGHRTHVGREPALAPRLVIGTKI